MGILLFDCNYNFHFCWIKPAIYLFPVLDMKKFIKYLLFFIAPFILFSYCIDVFISTNLKKAKKGAYGEYSTWNDVFEGKINSDIVIYGSSRAWKHISPKIINDRLHISTYNLGIDGHTFWLENFRHRMLLKNNTKPKIIIFSGSKSTICLVISLPIDPAAPVIRTVLFFN